MKTKRALIIIIIILLLTILGAGGLFVYSRFFKEDVAHIGKWNRNIDMTGYVQAQMNDWFGEAALGKEIDFGETKVYITVNLELGNDGKFTESIDEASVAAAQEIATQIAAVGLSDFLEKRLEAAGTSSSGVGKTPDELVEEALGMNSVDYLKQFGPSLLPTADELKAIYNVSGTYEVKEGCIKRAITGKSICEKYVVTGDYLMLMEETEDIFDKSIGQTIDGFDDHMKVYYDYPAVYSKGR